MMSFCVVIYLAMLYLVFTFARYFSFTAFKIFSFSLSFKSLIMLCLVIEFLVFILLGVLWASCVCRLMFFIKFRKFSVIISTDSFSSISPCPLLLRLSLYVYGIFDVVPQVPEALVHFSIIFSVYSSDWKISVSLYPSSLILSFAILNLMLSPSSTFSFQLLNSLTPEFSFGF